MAGGTLLMMLMNLKSILGSTQLQICELFCIIIY